MQEGPTLSCNSLEIDAHCQVLIPHSWQSTCQGIEELQPLDSNLPHFLHDSLSHLIVLQSHSYGKSIKLFL